MVSKNKNQQVNDNYKRKIGIALTNELPLRYFDSRNFIKNFKKSNDSTDYFKNKWRLKQFNLDLFIFSSIFKIIESLPKDFLINIRPHPLDSQTKLKQSLYRRIHNLYTFLRSESGHEFKWFPAKKKQTLPKLY